jgi:scyllo-inositol 2-dehydrogenase (NADP+)
MDPIGVGVIGSGMAARVFHLPVIQAVAGLKLRKIVDRHNDEAFSKYAGLETATDAAVLLKDKEIELVVVATPNSSHFDLARQSLLAGKHVVVEKPFTITSDQARELLDLAHRHARLITVHQNRRWDGDFLTVKNILETGTLGRIVEYESHFDRFRNTPRPGAWREEDRETGGMLFDLGSHLIDQALFLFGMPQMVTADIRNQRGFGNADDNFEVLLHYDGLKVTLKSGMLVRQPGPRFTVLGTQGSFVKFGLDPQEEALKNGQTPSEPGWGQEPRELWGAFNSEINGVHVEKRVATMHGCYQAFYQNLVDAIAGRAELAVKPEQAMNTIRIIELAKLSSRQKCSLRVS